MVRKRQSEREIWRGDGKGERRGLGLKSLVLILHCIWKRESETWQKSAHKTMLPWISHQWHTKRREKLLLNKCQVERKAYRLQNAELPTTPSLFSIISWSYSLISHRSLNNLPWEALLHCSEKVGNWASPIFKHPSKKSPNSCVVREDGPVWQWQPALN